MKYLFLVFILFLTNEAYGSENWRCTEEGLTREGSVFVSCGMSEGLTESFARKQALYHATQQFQDICKIDEECKNHKIYVEPGRTTCEKEDASHWKCYQLVRFSFGKKK